MKKNKYQDDYERLRLKRLSADEIKDQDAKVDAEVAMLKDIQETLSREIAKYMAKENIGIVELTKRLSTSTRQTNRIMKGEANLTLASLAEISALMGCRLQLVFK